MPLYKNCKKKKNL